MVAATMSLALAGQAASAADPALSSNQERYDGEALLKGLFFGFGPVADQYPELALVEAAETAEGARQLDELVAGIERREPGFLDKFAAAMYSGNQVTIDGAAADAGDLIGQVATDLYPEAAAAAPADAGLCVAGPLVVVVAGAAVAVAVAVVAVLDFYVLNAAYFYFGSADVPLGTTPASQLRYEQWINDVAVTLPGK